MARRALFCTKSFKDLYSSATEAFRNGNLELAAEFNSRALLLDEPSWRDVAAVNLNQAHILKLLAKFPDALTTAQKGLEALDRNFSSNKLEVCHALNVVAELNCELGNFDAALKDIVRAIEIDSRIGGPVFSNPRLGKSYNIKGAIFLNQDMLAQARSDFIRALAINVSCYGRSRPLPLSIGITLSNIANVLHKEGEGAECCVAIYREVVDSFEQKQDNSWMVGAALSDLAESLILTKTSAGVEEAKGLLARSLHILLSTRGIHHPSTEKSADLLKSISTSENSPGLETTEYANDFVDTLLNECELVIPKLEGTVSGDIIFLDRRGHVGHGHPHTRLF